MARQRNDGKGRMGGRAKGTTNKLTASTREWIEQLINDNRQQFINDLKTLSPKERVYIIERLLHFIIPKPTTPTTTPTPPPTTGELLIGFNDEQ